MKVTSVKIPGGPLLWYIKPVHSVCSLLPCKLIKVCAAVRLRSLLWNDAFLFCFTAYDVSVFISGVLPLSQTRLIAAGLSLSLSLCWDNRGRMRRETSASRLPHYLWNPYNPATASHIYQLKWYPSNNSQYVSRQQHFSHMQIISEQQSCYRGKVIPFKRLIIQ